MIAFAIKHKQSSLTLPKACFYLQAGNIFYQKIENALNKDLSLLGGVFGDSKISIHFGKDKTNSILR